jgi:exodeoxyribonuclease V beta subunit
VYKRQEYNIVFAPYLDFILGKDARYNKGKVCSFRNPKTKYYQSFPEYDTLNADEKIIFDQQESQENSRLIYVAITRAVYKCFIYKSNAKDSPLTYFVDALKETNPNLITQTNQYPTATTYSPLTTNHYPLTTNHSPVNFQLLQKNWHKLSYSFLKAPYQYYPTIKSNQKLNAYDNFIFNDLAKGAKAGNMLHYIFENIQLDNPKSWPQAINNALKNFTTKETDNYKTKLLELLQHSLNTTLNIAGQSFTLSAVNAKKCINEFEFDFMVSPFKIPQLKALEDANTQINLSPGNNLEGVMNGKIDLFFEHLGKYYVLDWKSNYLGNDIENYNTNNLNQAMNHSNYHLQYLIYTLATKKYLESRLPSFNYQTQFGGVIYLFVRGLRTGQQTGVFIAQPSAKKIQLLDEILST